MHTTTEHPVPPLAAGERFLDYTYGDQSALHVGNLMDENINGSNIDGQNSASSELAQVLPTYKTRALRVLRPQDHIVVPASLVSTTQELSAYHQDLGLHNFKADHIHGVPETPGKSLSQTLLQEQELLQELLKKYSAITRILPFIQSPNTQQLAEQLGLSADCHYTAANLANNKGFALAELQKRGISVPEGYTAHTNGDVWKYFQDLQNKGARTVYGKLARAVSGEGVFPLCSEEDVENFLRKEVTQLQLHTPGLGVRLDYGIETDMFPNVMVWVDKDPSKHRRLGSSYQLLAKRSEADAFPTVHKGNVGPLTDEHMAVLEETIAGAVAWLHSIGAYGMAGVDLMLEPRTDGSLKPYVLEINFRFNGNSHASITALELGASHWACNNNAKVPTNMSLQQYASYLQQQGVEYNKQQKEGIALMNMATNIHGKAQVMAVGNTRAQVEEYLKQAHIL